MNHLRHGGGPGTLRIWREDGAVVCEVRDAGGRGLWMVNQLCDLVQLRTMHLGPEELLVAARVELGPDLSADDAARVIDQAQAAVREQVPTARIIYLEPELPAAPVPQPGMVDRP